MAVPCGSTRHGWRLKECSHAITQSTRCRLEVRRRPRICELAPSSKPASGPACFEGAMGTARKAKITVPPDLFIDGEAPQAFAEAILEVDSY
jgi:hypothetical protein